MTALDQFLHDLRICGIEYRLAPEPPNDVDERVYSTCPSCRTEGCLTLEIVEHVGWPVEVECLKDCSEFQIHRALARNVHLSLAAELEAA